MVPPESEGGVSQLTIGQRIQEARQARGWSQRELSRKARVSYTHIASLERDDVSPSIRILEHIAEALGIPVATLIGVEMVSDTLADRLRAWLQGAPDEKRAFVFEAAKMAGFPSAAMTPAVS